MAMMDLFNRFGAVECCGTDGASLSMKWEEMDEVDDDPSEINLTLVDGDGDGIVTARADVESYGVELTLTDLAGNKLMAEFRKTELRAFAEALIELCDREKK